MAPSIIKTVITFFESSKTPITYIVALTLGFKLFRWYVAGGVCVSKKRLDGKTVIITGCNTGIGLETAKELSARGARIVMACRDIDKAHKASEIVKKFSGNSDVSVELLDLASLDSVRKFAENVNNDEARIDILINNAGVMMCPKWRSDDGYEMQFAVNHLGHFLLTTLLLDRIKESAPSRIINISSFAHYGKLYNIYCIFEYGGSINFEDINSDQSYSSIYAYNQSKLANILFTKELAKRLQGTGVTTTAIHPGTVKTELSRYVRAWFRPFYIFMKTPLQGTQTTLHCALDERLDTVSGKYFSDCAEKQPSRAAMNMEDAKRLWELSEEMVTKATK